MYDIVKNVVMPAIASVRKLGLSEEVMAADCLTFVMLNFWAQYGRVVPPLIEWHSASDSHSEPLDELSIRTHLIVSSIFRPAQMPLRNLSRRFIRTNTKR